MEQSNQVQPRGLLDGVIQNTLNFCIYGLLGMVAAFLFLSCIIGIQEIPNRIDTAKKQYVDYQVKINNPKYVDASFSENE